MTNDQKAVLAHVVVDPDAWYQHAINTFGQEQADQFLEKKVERHRADYELESQKSGYKNRAEHELDEAKARIVALEQA